MRGFVLALREAEHGGEWAAMFAHLDADEDQHLSAAELGHQSDFATALFVLSFFFERGAERHFPPLSFAPMSARICTLQSVPYNCRGGRQRKKPSLFLRIPPSFHRADCAMPLKLIPVADSAAPTRT